tara:strand:+ start:2021 stop:2659 length:639 start_codon:yes stop_codon:yes gene_type:complete
MKKLNIFKIDKKFINYLKVGLNAMCNNKCRYLSFPYLSVSTIVSLTNQVSKFRFRKAKPLAGNSVTQDFDVCFPAPRIGKIDQLASSIENLFNQTLRSMYNPPIKCPKFNDIAIQRYKPGSLGISPHKDHKKYISVIIIITLSGRSDLCICENRKGLNQLVVNDAPGNIVVLPASEFMTLNNNCIRPLHFVNNISDGRLSIGLRQNSEITFT